jgi:NAD(P)-dependent dehydrogenase (short-subunit alcohol dehydrogenase family)
VAVVIGGGSGVGAAVTLALAKAGVDLAFCDVKEDSIEPTRAQVERLGRRVTARVTDAFDSGQLAAFYEAFDHDFDRLDVVVNLAGGGQMFRDFAESTPEQWNGDIHRNFEWVLQSMSMAIPRIRAGGRGGSVINFTTIEAHRGAARIAAYAGAKAGLTNFSRAVAVELATERIRVNLLAPDTTPSATSTNAVSAETLHETGFDDPELMAKSFAVYVPMGTAPPAEDLGDAVLFLASDLSASVTGTTLHVDGGTSASLGFLHWPPPLGWMPAPPAIWFRDEPSS